VIAWVREEVTIELPLYRYTASWQPDPRAPAETFRSEDGPGWNELAPAIAWGRARAPIVYVRRGLEGREIYNAGELDDGARPPTARWPGSRRRRAGGVQPDYGGIVWVDEESPVVMPALRFSAWCDSESRTDFTDIDAAVDWARERAPVVLVARLPSSWQGAIPAYEIRSAGADDPPDGELERIRPRAGDETMVWAFSAMRAASTCTAEELAPRLEAALRSDDSVSQPSCQRCEEPNNWAGTVPLGAGMPPPIRGWLEVGFHLSAPTEKLALKLAFAALLRALNASGEGPIGYLGSYTLNAARLP